MEDLIFLTLKVGQLFQKYEREQILFERPDFNTLEFEDTNSGCLIRFGWNFKSNNFIKESEEATLYIANNFDGDYDVWLENYQSSELVRHTFDDYDDLRQWMNVILEQFDIESETLWSHYTGSIKAAEFIKTITRLGDHRQIAILIYDAIRDELPLVHETMAELHRSGRR